MAAKLTELQRYTLEKLAKYDPGSWRSFGCMSRRLRTELVELWARALVTYEKRYDFEFYCITSKGRRALDAR